MVTAGQVDNPGEIVAWGILCNFFMNYTTAISALKPSPSGDHSAQCIKLNIQKSAVWGQQAWVNYNYRGISARLTHMPIITATAPTPKIWLCQGTLKRENKNFTKHF